MFRQYEHEKKTTGQKKAGKAVKSKSGNELKIQQKEIAKTLNKIGLNIS